jgi:hypothetical protein
MVFARLHGHLLSAALVPALLLPCSLSAGNVLGKTRAPAQAEGPEPEPGGERRGCGRLAMRALLGLGLAALASQLLQSAAPGAGPTPALPLAPGGASLEDGLPEAEPAPAAVPPGLPQAWPAAAFAEALWPAPLTEDQRVLGFHFNRPCYLDQMRAQASVLRHLGQGANSRAIRHAAADSDASSALAWARSATLYGEARNLLEAEAGETLDEARARVVEAGLRQLHNRFLAANAAAGCLPEAAQAPMREALERLSGVLDALVIAGVRIRSCDAPAWAVRQGYRRIPEEDAIRAEPAPDRASSASLRWRASR